jgi:hypothetical protein
MKLLPYALAGALLLAAPAARPAEPDPRVQAQAAIRDLDLQADLPLAPVDDGWRLKLPPEVLRLFLWGAVIVGVGVVLWSLRDSLPDFGGPRRIAARDDGTNAADAGSDMRIARLEADELAQTGRFVEAMHVLLLQSLVEMRRRLDVKFADSLTSREILRMTRLPTPGQAALGSIIGEVERTYFGEHGATERDYENCRRNFETLKALLETGIAAA